MSLKRDSEFGHLVGVESHPLVKPYEFVEFPKWKYHDSNPSVIVKDAEEEAALGDGWRDTPKAPEAEVEAESE